MNTFKNEEGKSILLKMVSVIQANKDYLGDVDGQIGDGDHGANMNKGFTEFEKKHQAENFSFTDGLDKLGTVLEEDIGGSMGPIYGTIFLSMAEAGEDLEEIGLSDFTNMLEHGLEELEDIVEAREGDKTLVDTLSPSVKTLKQAVEQGKTFADALQDMKQAAEAGKDSTKDMVARYGRSARLGERSRGVLDAGATSCCLILQAMADGILEKLG